MTEIPYPESNSEFEVQAFLYLKLQSLGIDVKGEVSACGCRLDLVLYVKRIAKLVIEVKRWFGVLETLQKQKAKYEYATGVPCCVICGMKEAARFIETFDASQYQDTQEIQEMLDATEVAKLMGFSHYKFPERELRRMTSREGFPFPRHDGRYAKSEVDTWFESAISMALAKRNDELAGGIHQEPSNERAVA